MRAELYHANTYKYFMDTNFSFASPAVVASKGALSQTHDRYLSSIASFLLVFNVVQVKNQASLKDGEQVPIRVKAELLNR